MRNRKKRRKGEEGLAAQPLGPASPVRARRPSKQAQATAAAHAPSPRQLPLPLGPARQRRAVHPHAPLPFAAVAASGPRPSAIPCSSSPRRAQPSADRRPTASAERARGSRPSHGLAPLGVAPTQPLMAVGCKQAPRLPLIPVRRSPSSMAELGYKGHGPRSPSARPVARRHLGGHPLRTQT